MERINSINRNRIAWCCADFGITPEQLAAEAGVPLASLQKMLNGEGALTFKQLSKVAQYFGRGVLFFLQDEPVVAEQAHTPAFRTLANQKPELSAKLKTFIERAERQRSVYLSLREELESGDLPRFKPPELPQDPERAANIAREWLGLGRNNDFESYREAVEAKGILVFRSNGYQGKWQIAKESPILGFSLYDETCPLIVVKKRNSESQQAFTLMHELGHLLLHKMSSIDDDQDMHSYAGGEREANAFAGNLLVPQSFLLEIDDGERPDNVAEYEGWLAPQRRAWGVSTEVLLRRLLDNERLSRAQYQAFRRWCDELPPREDGGSRAWRHREPKNIFGDVFVRTVLDALNNKYITLSKASTYLDGLKINDLHRLEQHYASL